MTNVKEESVFIFVNKRIKVFSLPAYCLSPAGELNDEIVLKSAS